MLKFKKDSLKLFRFKNLSKFNEIEHFITTRKGGFSKSSYDSLNLGFHVNDDPKKVLKNRKKLAQILKIPLKNFTLAKQVHGNNEKFVTLSMKGRGAFEYKSGISNIDALITDIPRILLMILVADCVPILFFDHKKKVIGIAHAGRKGTFQKFSQNVINAFIRRYHSNPADIIIGIGPSIGPCHYEVDSEIIKKANRIFPKLKIKINEKGKGFLNLWRMNEDQLENVGIIHKNIEVAKICTYEKNDLFFSERFQKGKTGRFGAGIMLKN